MDYDNWKQSMDKWDDDILYNKIVANGWGSVWVPCGFCDEFRAGVYSCDRCPLFNKNHCTDEMSTGHGRNNTMFRMKLACRDRDRDAFEKERKMFVRYIKRFKPRGKKGDK